MGEVFQHVFLQDQLLLFQMDLLDQADVDARLPLECLHVGLVCFIQRQALNGHDKVPFFLRAELDLDSRLFHGFQEFRAEIFQFLVIGELELNDVDLLFQAGRQIVVGRKEKKEFSGILELQVAFADLARQLRAVAQARVQVLEKKKSRFAGLQGVVQRRSGFQAARDRAIHCG